MKSPLPAQRDLTAGWRLAFIRRCCFFALLTACLSCTPTYYRYDPHWIMRLAAVQPPGWIGPQDISVDSTVSTFYDNTLRIQWAWGTDARLHFVLDNLTPDSLRVIWEDARYVDERQNSHRVMHAGVKFADRGEPRLEIPVAPLGKMVDFVQPVYVLIPDPRDSTALLRKAPLMKIRGANPHVMRREARAHRGRRVEIELPVIAHGRTTVYHFVYQVDHVELR